MFSNKVMQSTPAPVHNAAVPLDGSHGSIGELPWAFELCVRKARFNILRLANLPKAAPWAVDGDYFAHTEEFNSISNWTSSFFTGMALIAWRKTGDEYFLKQLLRLEPAYREKAANPEFHSHHDMGFLYSLYSVALYKLTGDKIHRETGLRAAEALCLRYNPIGQFIRAWGKLGTAEYANLAIIDCMMNLPLLFWAFAESGHDRFRQIAVESADTALNHFVRADGSVFHAYQFDPTTGAPIGGDNYCGRDVNSHWARGTGWAIYGFALAYRYTSEKKYLQASLRLGRKFIEELNGELLPVWDFRLPPGEPALRDTSAAAVVVCGLQEIETLGAGDSALRDAQNSLLANLCSASYLNSDESCPGVLRDGQVNADGPATAANAYTSWGDYYLMEAVDRALHKSNSLW